MILPVLAARSSSRYYDSCDTLVCSLGTSCVFSTLSVHASFHEIVPVPTRPSSSMEDSQIDKLFAGDMENLPPWRQPLIRLYLSSTYTDMTLEKTALFAEVYPKLKEYCREKYGLEFQVSSILTLVQVSGVWLKLEHDLYFCVYAYIHIDNFFWPTIIYYSFCKRKKVEQGKKKKRASFLFVVFPLFLGLFCALAQNIWTYLYSLCILVYWG